MTAIPRRVQKVFGVDLTPTGNVAVFGSLAAGSPAYSSDPKVIQSLSNFGLGFNGAVVGNRSPAIEDMNGLMLAVTQQLAYILQSGVPEWNADTTYWPTQFCRVGTVLYVCTAIVSSTGNDPTSDTNNWQPYFAKAKGPSLVAAWAVFSGNLSSGGNSTIFSSFNVDHIVKNKTGSYTVHFAEDLSSVHYTLTGSCGTEGGLPFAGGDTIGVVVGDVPSEGDAVRSASACRVFTIDPSTKGLIQSGYVSVVFIAP